VPSSDYEPSLAQVGRKNLSRTKDQFGNPLGTFTAATTPTDTMVTNIIQDILPEVADRIGDDIPNVFWDDAANVAAYRAAMQIELDVFSDQISTGRSIYPQLNDLYEKALSSLNKSIEGFEAGDTGADSGATGTHPRYSFPDAGPIGMNNIFG
jgi:hypothetical protein